MLPLKSISVRILLLLLATLLVTACDTPADSSSVAGKVKLNLVAAKAATDGEPIVNASKIPNVALALGTSLHVNLDEIVDTPSGGFLHFIAESTAPGVVAASIDGCDLVLAANGVGDAVVEVSATIGGEGDCADTIRASGPPSENQSPEISQPIPAQSLTTADSPVTIDLATVFSDPEGRPLTYAATSGNSDVVDAGIDGSALILTPLSAGSSTVTVVATDDRGASAQATASVTVMTPDQAPVVSGRIADQTLTTADPPVTIDLATVFTDPEGGPLTFSATSGDAAVTTASVNGSTLTITAQSPGATTVTVVATDNQGATAQDVATVTVTNQAPVIDHPIPNQSLTTADPPITIDLTTVFSDPEGGPLTFSATTGDPGVATVSVSGNILTITAQSPGSADITVVAVDNLHATARDVAEVTVTEPNQPPVVASPIPDLSKTTSDGPTTINLAATFSDPEGGALTYSAVSSDTGAVSATISGSTLTVSALAAGVVTVSVTATDDHGATVQDVFRVTVTAANQPPVVSAPIADLTTSVTTPVTINLDAHFTDPEGGPLTYSAVSSNVDFASVSVSGSTLTINPQHAGAAVTITVTATDNHGASTPDSFTVTVVTSS